MKKHHRIFLSVGISAIGCAILIQIGKPTDGWAFALWIVAVISCVLFSTME